MKPKAGRSPTCRLWTADANSYMPCYAHAVPMPRCAMTLRSRFQNGMDVAWHRRGMGATCARHGRDMRATWARHARDMAVWMKHGMAWERRENGVRTAWCVCVSLKGVYSKTEARSSIVGAVETVSIT
jgi:hypothetical protein